MADLAGRASTEAAGETLETVWRAVRAALEGAARPGAPFNKSVLATRGLDGTPQARTIILREVDLSTGRIRIHTDARSAKCTEIRACPDVTLLGYDGEGDVQLRIKAKGAVHIRDEVADAAWEGASDSSLRAYLVEAAPGTARAAPGTGLPEDVEGRIPKRARLVDGRENFAVIRLQIAEIDWLRLAREGNRRARFTFAGGKGGTRAGDWLQP
mgnify:FL=1